MKITKTTNLQNMDFVNRESAIELSRKPVTRFDAIVGLAGTAMVGVGSAMCFVGETDMAIKTFGASIIVGLIIMAVERGLNK